MAGCIWDEKLLFLEPEHLTQLPQDIIAAITTASNVKYLDILAKLALEPCIWTEIIFTRYQPLFVDFVGRWLQNLEAESSGLRCLSALSRILPHAPHLFPFVEEIVFSRKVDVFSALGPSAKPTAILQFSEPILREILLIFLRVLPCDDERLTSLVSPAQLQLLLSHNALHIRFLACKAFCMVFRFTDKVLSKMFEKHVGSVPLEAEWDGRAIDYRFLDLWESKRLKNLEQMRRYASEAKIPPVDTASIRVISPGDICPLALDLAGYLAPNFSQEKFRPGNLILTPAASRNLAGTACALSESQAILVTGLQGCGKTSVIKEAAQNLNQAQKLITLHLNAETDAKLLLGFYTSSVESGSFKWQQGVLTRAVLEGHWLLIEDLDRAPKEVVSILLPLLDRQELMVPNLGGALRAAKSFKIIATTRCSQVRNSEELAPTDGMIGDRFWRKVKFQQYTESDLQQIIDGRFPLLKGYRLGFLSMYNKLIELTRNSTLIQRSERTYGLQQLLRYCSRVDKLLREAGISNGMEPVPESLQDEMFLEAVDCFGSALPKGRREMVIDIIAQELHMSEARMRFCLTARLPKYQADRKTLKIGRVTLRKSQSQLLRKTSGALVSAQSFAYTNHALRIMEQIGVAVKSREPCLLVGETGVGKTTLVQELASSLGQKLVVVNLSNQSEGSDLLGGYKPVNIRSLATPIKDEFDLLFKDTFSAAKNELYLKSVNRTFRKSEWTRVLTLWEEALKMIERTFATGTRQQNSSNPQKKRKIETARYQKLKPQWESLAVQVSIFRKHLHSGSKGFAFSFIEGSIVKAVRNGHWVLLDEINLASSDTLESIADLLVDGLDVSPSLLLTETGQADEVRAHPDFRIFGAMNPATDVGKKDLPPSIRSRWTEYFVSSPEEDPESLSQIVKTYLGDNANQKARLAQDVVQLYLEIRSLEHDNCLVDGANQRPHFTLRTLTRTLVYTKDVEKIYGIRRALFEGFTMTFLGPLSPDSATLVGLQIIKYLLGSDKDSKALLNQSPRCPGHPDQFVEVNHHWIHRGPLPTRTQPHYIRTPTIEKHLLNLVRATSTRRYPILLQGPTASGKTSMIEYLANLTGNTFIRINNHEHTDLQEYIGNYVSDNNGLHFQDGVLVQALKDGYWLVLDELNLAPTDVLEALNRLLDDNRELFIPETQELVRPHKDFMLFATQNPSGVYGGRKVLSRAFRNRFLELHFGDIPEGELETILRERSQIAPSYCTRIVAVFKKLAMLRQSNRLFEQKNSFATLRDLFRWTSRQADTLEELAANGFMLLAERVRDPEERDEVKKIIEEVMGLKLDVHKIYNADKLAEALNSVETGKQSKNIVMTKSVIRLLTLITHALKNNEPVLLVSDTGSGKTTACQVIAEIFGVQLNILNAHQNTETGDIIGSQRPVRNKQHLEASFHNDLKLAADIVSFPWLESTSDAKELYDAYRNLPADAKHQLAPDLRQRIEENGKRVCALFEWSDGSLVRSMKAGHHFLLDEISLADDSVLERMNSVLEPSRSILLAEKGSVDNFIKAHEKFRFLATMNPGGDYGKRELSPALRGRLTEIWVSPLLDDEDVLQITVSKLSPTLSRLAGAIVSFSRWFHQWYEGNGPSSVLRQILSWVEFLNFSIERDLPFSIVSGAALVYIDALGANPSGKAAISKDAISQERQRCLDRLSSLFAIDASALYFNKPQLTITDADISLGSFTIRKRTRESKLTNFTFDNRTTMTNATRIARALQLSKPILIEGSPATGKSTLVGALAGMVGVSLTRINLSEQTDLMDLFGSDVPVENGEIGQFQWRDAPFLQAMKRGDWILLDEMNLASQSILEGLNACLDHREEVHIPELDQVFSRDPEFKLFATQNPYTDGGGRKGLPASFVNRFTVVYADAFAEEDILSISTRLFPKVSTEHVQQVVRSVSALNACMAGTGNSSMSMQSCEFNLRDVLRWVHLLNSKSSLFSRAVPSELEAPIILNRLRSEGDVRRAGQAIRSLCDVKASFHNYFLNADPSSLQCGYGYLNKREVSSFLPVSQARHVPRLIESVFIAIQENWPCLMVGAPESSSLIRNLAVTYGARVSTISLSADVDATELVGGYEQVDHQRYVAKFSTTLRETLKDYLSKMLLSDPGLEDGLSEFGVLLSGTFPDLKFTSETIRRLAEKDPHLFQPLLDSCLYIIQQSSIDSRARFEWVDSIVIEAMQQGHWLVLENANLCSSSVLDRLNALLEPGGTLSVHEHRSADGSPHVVVPHAAFRVFLTIDPRHGEPSRAMRNRCLELYIPEDHEKEAGKLTLFDGDYQTSRFRNVDLFDWGSMSDEESLYMLQLCVDHLAPSDLELLEAWQKEMSNGLVNLTPKMKRMLGWASRVFRLMANDSIIIRTIERLYMSMVSAMHVGQSLIHTIEAQPLNPLNNSPLVSQLRKTGSMNKALWIADFLDCQFALAHLQDQLEMLGQANNPGWRTTTNRLERSILESRSRAFSKDSTIHLHWFFLNLLETIESWSKSRFSSNYEVEEYPRAVVDYVVDLFEVSKSEPFDESKFQAYLRLGRALAHSLQKKLSLAEIGQFLQSGLGKFDPMWALTTGLSMQLLWASFRPTTPPNVIDLKRILDLEAVADKFDLDAWRSDSTMQSILVLRTSLDKALKQLKSSQTPIFDDIHAQEPDEFRHMLQLAAIANESLVIADDRTKPYLCNEFESLRQYMYSYGVPNSPENQVALDLLSGRSTKDAGGLPDSLASTILLSSLRNCTGIDTESCQLSALKGTLPLNIVRKCSQMPEIPLRYLSRLNEELSLFTNQVANATEALDVDQRIALRNLLSDLLYQILEAHNNVIEPESLQEWAHFLRDPKHAETPKSLVMCQSSETSGANPGLPASFKKIASQYFHSALSYFREDTEGKHEPTLSADSAWINIFIGSLKLYVPNALNDPAMMPLVEAERWAKRKRELSIQLSALEAFEQKVNGSQSSLRCEIVRQRLSDLGEQRSTPSMARPLIPRMKELQEEFRRVIEFIILPCERILIGSSRDDAELHIILSNIGRFISRLTDGYREYQDLTGPLVGLLRGLAVGLTLRLMKFSSSRPSSEITLPFNSNLTVLGLNIREPPLSIRTQSSVSGSEPCDRGTMLLEYLVLEKSTLGYLESDSVQKATEVLHSFFKSWKRKLQAEQAQLASRSSLYHYKGESEAVFDDRKDLDSLFPNTIDYRAPDQQIESKIQESPQTFAQTASLLHWRLFASDFQDQKPVISFAREVVSRINTWDLSQTACSSAQAVGLAPVMLLAMDEAHNSILTDGENVKSNFYHESNVREVKELVSFLRKLRARVRTIQTSWPEHETLKDILKTAEELLDVKLSAPLVSIVPQTEKLLTFVDEWQQRASKDPTREFSLQSFYDDLTKLLISWRRLELSAWAILLDNEDKNYVKEAQSWWFVAYEAIFSPFWESVGSDYDPQDYLEDLVAELQKFVRNAPLGQFEARLRMLQMFHRHAEYLVQSVPIFRQVSDVLANTLGYFKRWSLQVRARISAHRGLVNGKLKETLFLASLKDTTISALRASARKSHYHLLKIVRQYRELLGQESHSLFQEPVSEDYAKSYLDNKLHRKPPKSFDDKALQVCRHSFPAWLQGARFLEDPMETAASMSHLAVMPPKKLNSQSHVSSFRVNLLEAIQSLQHETPRELTPENKSQVKHLKARKRNLLADTLKQIRQLGIRTNLDSKTLENQATTEKILSSLPFNPELSDSDQQLYMVVDEMSVARQTSKQHSQDLTSSEISRSLGLLEGLLCHLIKQRQGLGEAFLELQSLEESTSSLNLLWNPAEYEVKPRDNKSPNRDQYSQRFRWLETIINGTQFIIKKLERMGGNDFSPLENSLQQKLDKGIKLRHLVEALPPVPRGLATSVEANGLSEVNEFLTAFNADILQWTIEFPKAKFILKYLQPWLNIEAKIDLPREFTPANVSVNWEGLNGENSATNHPMEVDELEVFKTVDRMLVGIQSLKKAFEQLPESSEYAGWLVQEEKILHKATRSLRPREIAIQINEHLLSRMPTLQSDALNSACALCAVIFPITQQYRSSFCAILERRVASYSTLCELALLLSRTFNQLAAQGFCSPQDTSGEQAKSGKMEEGVGLGDGEGAEDISKDIREDEDLSGAAQGPQLEKDKDNEKTEGHDDAIDVEDEELADGMEDAAEDSATDDGSGQDQDSEEEEMTDEVGEVDDFDSAAVDEKIWEGAARDARSEKEDRKTNGEKSGEVSAQIEQDEGSQVSDGEGNEDHGNENSEQFPQTEAEPLGSNVEEVEELGLPEDALIDGKPSPKDLTDDEDIDNMSDMDTQDDESLGSNDLGEEDTEMHEPGESAQDENTPDQEKKGHDETATAQPSSADQEDLNTLDDKRPVEDLDADMAESDDMQADQLNGSDFQREEQEVSNGASTKYSQNEGKSSRDVPMPDIPQDPQELEEGEGKGDRRQSLDVTQNERDPTSDVEQQPFRKLGEALERWHRANRAIRNPTDEQTHNSHEEQELSSGIEFEHLKDKNDKADAQALDAATEEEAKALNQNQLEADEFAEAIEHSENDRQTPYPEAMDVDHELESAEEELDTDQTDVEAFTNEENPRDGSGRPLNILNSEEEEEVSLDNIDSELSEVQLNPENSLHRSVEEARRLWSTCERNTRELSTSLTEQLRLILAPTQATKMRGDFRTGKRLNIKRIIPYIASQYKRDKIWMRRSVPSKRNYQVMIAVDDSKSMAESGSGKLAFESLALLSRSLGMLEVGQLCIASFGDNFQVAHPFEQEFSTESAIHVMQHFRFQQKSTKITTLLRDSLDVFRQARARQTSSGADTWQLQLIVSDGVCEDHESIRRLVRQAHKERIIVIIIIVDTSKHSIINMTSAEFENVNGEMKLKVKQYLADFPFTYYLVVRDITGLPNVLSKALSQWFSEISDTA